LSIYNPHHTVPSPKCATYDLEPAMSQRGVGEAVCKALDSGKYPLVLCNLAAPDMVGHTGAYEPCIEACTVCDEVIGEIRKACERNGAVLIVTGKIGRGWGCRQWFF
jgi:2,3-bisphosphoglycerate-independent phosphoglycerate mutase